MSNLSHNAPGLGQGQREIENWASKKRNFQQGLRRRVTTDIRPQTLHLAIHGCFIGVFFFLKSVWRAA
jgi:hypothetical protein